MRRKVITVHWQERCGDQDCDLCAARERKRRDDELRAKGKPTLTHQPFADLLRKRVS